MLDRTCRENSRSRAIRRVVLFGIVVNLVLAGTKVYFGSRFSNMALLADAGNNFSDTLAQVVALMSVYLSAKPADGEHPFGHARMEYVSSLILAFLVAAMGVELIRSSISQLRSHAAPEIETSLLIFMALSILVKGVCYGVYRRMSLRLDSILLKASASDYLADVMLSATILVSALLYRMVQLNSDAFVALLVSALILRSAYRILKQTVSRLLGEKPARDLQEAIETSIQAEKGVLSYHDLIVHDYGFGHRFASVDICLPANMSVLEAHAIVDRIEEGLNRETGLHLATHIDPVLSGDQTVRRLTSRLLEILKAENAGHMVHDIQVKTDEETGEPLLCFDLALGEKFRGSAEPLCERIHEQLQADLNGIGLEIRLERGYTRTIWRGETLGPVGRR